MKNRTRVLVSILAAFMLLFTPASVASANTAVDEIPAGFDCSPWTVGSLTCDDGSPDVPAGFDCSPWTGGSLTCDDGSDAYLAYVFNQDPAPTCFAQSDLGPGAANCPIEG